MADTSDRNLDLSMLTYCGANQRTVEDWKGILTQADTRLKMKNVVRKEGEMLVLLEVVLDK
jgi:hypothetical protein